VLCYLARFASSSDHVSFGRRNQAKTPTLPVTSQKVPATNRAGTCRNPPLPFPEFRMQKKKKSRQFSAAGFCLALHILKEIRRRWVFSVPCCWDKVSGRIGAFRCVGCEACVLRGVAWSCAARMQLKVSLRRPWVRGCAARPMRLGERMLQGAWVGEGWRWRRCCMTLGILRKEDLLRYICTESVRTHPRNCEERPGWSPAMHHSRVDR
jgi:hypothetical protein